jgi:hypothetical protein
MDLHVGRARVEFPSGSTGIKKGGLSRSFFAFMGKDATHPRRPYTSRTPGRSTPNAGRNRKHRRAIPRRGLSAHRLVGVAAVVVTQNLSSNERIWIATDDPVARDHIVRMHANARTESVIWVRLSIIGCGCSTIPLGVTSRIGTFGSDHRGERQEHADEPVLYRCDFHCRTCLVHVGLTREDNLRL